MATISISTAGWRWNLVRERAALALAHGSKPATGIAAELGINPRTLWEWQHQPEFTARVEGHLTAYRHVLRQSIHGDSVGRGRVGLSAFQTSLNAALFSAIGYDASNPTDAPLANSKADLSGIRQALLIAILQIERGQRGNLTAAMGEQQNLSTPARTPHASY